MLISRRQQHPLLESPAKIQQEVLQNWDRYWEQATPVDIGTINEWFAITDDVPPNHTPNNT